MLKIIGDRQSGKTTLLVERSAEHGVPILCKDNNSKRVIQHMAKDLHLEIPTPITIHELYNNNSTIEDIYIDDADIIIRDLIGKYNVHNIVGIAMNDNDLGDTTIETHRKREVINA